MVKEIVTDYEALSERSEEIDVKKENAEMREIILALKDTIKANNLKALAAPQIGYQRRIFCINFNGDIRTYINPLITKVEGLEIARERCESCPGKEYIRPRHNKVTALFQNPLGKSYSQQLVGMAAIVFQELVDHLEGLLLSDIGLEIDEQFDQATEEERMEVINAYLDSLDIKRAEVAKDIENTTELKQLSDAVRFMESVREGKTQIEYVTESKKDED